MTLHEGLRAWAEQQEQDSYETRAVLLHEHAPMLWALLKLAAHQ